MPAICQLAGLKGQTPIMIDWSDLGRKRGLPLLTWATAHDELNPSQNRLEEAFIARLLRWLQEMPRHTGRPVDYVVRLKGNVHIQTADGYLWYVGKMNGEKSICDSPAGRAAFPVGVV